MLFRIQSILYAREHVRAWADERIILCYVVGVQIMRCPPDSSIFIIIITIVMIRVYSCNIRIQLLYPVFMNRIRVVGV